MSYLVRSGVEEMSFEDKIKLMPSTELLTRYAVAWHHAEFARYQMRLDTAETYAKDANLFLEEINYRIPMFRKDQL